PCRTGPGLSRMAGTGRLSAASTGGASLAQGAVAPADCAGGRVAGHRRKRYPPAPPGRAEPQTHASGPAAAPFALAPAAMAVYAVVLAASAEGRARPLAGPALSPDPTSTDGEAGRS